MSSVRYFIVGGAGFIGSHFTDRLLGDEATAGVTLYDNFSSGREWHYEHHKNDGRLRVVRGDVKDLATLTTAIAGHDVVIHLASNPDIAKAATEPDIDFREGTFLTSQVVEAMRVAVFPDCYTHPGSGVYGDIGTVEAGENYSPMLPISTYGASKLAGEMLICSYCYMFGMTARAFRFGNVVGPRQTHGVGFDFVRQLLKNPGELKILGDGTQSKSYIHVQDVMNAVLTAHRAADTPFNVYNVATGDYITVTEIGRLAAEVAGLDPAQVKFVYSGGNRGWKGDVPIVRLNTDRIQGLGWKCSRSTSEALKQSMSALLTDAKLARL